MCEGVLWCSFLDETSTIALQSFMQTRQSEFVRRTTNTAPFELETLVCRPTAPRIPGGH
jgi:hypothetical protein